MQSALPDVVGGKRSGEKSAHKLPLCYKQSDNILVVLHLYLMSVQAARYANARVYVSSMNNCSAKPFSLGGGCAAARLPAFFPPKHFCSPSVVSILK